MATIAACVTCGLSQEKIIKLSPQIPFADGLCQHWLPDKSMRCSQAISAHFVEDNNGFYIEDIDLNDDDDNGEYGGGPSSRTNPAIITQRPSFDVGTGTTADDIMARLNSSGSSNSISKTSGGTSQKFKRTATMVWASGKSEVKVVVTGIAAAVPGRGQPVFSAGVDNVKRIIAGENFITPVPDNIKEAMLDMNIVQIVKNKDGTQTKKSISSHEDHINLCAAMGTFSLEDYDVSESIANTMDRSVQVAVMAGLEALKDAGLVSGQGGPTGWHLPKSMQDTTGVVFATSFPALDTAVAEVSKYYRSKSAHAVTSHVLLTLEKLKVKLQQANGAAFAGDLEEAFQTLQNEATLAASNTTEIDSEPYEFDRKFLFRVLVLGNAQLAQMIQAKGPNMQTNAACAGATQAIALAYDLIQVGRAERVVVIAGDNASSDDLIPWLGGGFRALGAASKCAQVERAAIPFNAGRRGLIIGCGGIGMVLESEDGARRRFERDLADRKASVESVTGIAIPAAAAASHTVRQMPFRCRLLGTLISNSAYHGASLDREHIAAEMERFIKSIETEQGISRREIACKGVYFSHETSTYVSPTSSCAAHELYGLRKVFGENFKDLLILNTKGFTGHAMGVSFEDVVASEVLVSCQVPPIANFTECDPALGSDVKLSRGGYYPCKFALRFAAGFGSQVALALYGAASV